MKITREKLIAMWQLFSQISNNKTSVKFHYLILKNKKLLTPEIESLQKVQEPPSGFDVFEEKRVSLCNGYCEKNEEGIPLKENKNFVIRKEDQEEFDKKIEELKEEFSEIISIMDNAQSEFLTLIKEEVEIELVKIPLSVMPESLLGREVELLYEIIDEDA